jgi:hypothetical protein
MELVEIKYLGRDVGINKITLVGQVSPLNFNYLRWEGTQKKK